MLKYELSFSFLLICSILMGQNGVQTENDLGVEELIKDVFIKGNCRNVSNIRSIGNDSLSIGQFSNGKNVFDLEDGIIISTGTIDLAEGPNIRIDASHSFGDITDDPDLNRLATDSLFDVTGLEFDFVPIGNRVSFRYVFASEEYCEFVGTSFNDVFGFFVSGPGINGSFDNQAINVATLSGTNENVSINTVNHLDNTNFYQNNATTTDAENCDINFNPKFQDLTEYDGFTIPLTATFIVEPCETYHIRLVLGDVGDANLDSAVFLESKSFDLGEKVNVRAEVPGSDEPRAYENCVDGQMVFTRSNPRSVNEACTVAYTISSDSKAINGVDFEEIPLSVTIPAGEVEYILPIKIIDDALLEGPENIKLQFEYACDCLDQSSSELIIDETTPFSADHQDINVCANQSFVLTPEITDGIPPYDLLWSTGARSDSLETQITQPTSYSVTITDFCKHLDTVDLNVDIQSTPIASLTGTYDLCESTETGIAVIMEGNPPWTLSYSIDGELQDTLENLLSSPYYLATPAEGSYTLISFSDAYCDGTVLGEARVEYSTFDVEIDLIQPSCPEHQDGRIEITRLDAIPPFSIEWDTQTNDEYVLENIMAGSYTLSITDGNGCLYEKTIDLEADSAGIEECAPFYIPNIFSPNADGVNEVFTIFTSPISQVQNVVSLEVYDRWGNLVFLRNNFLPNNLDKGWNGTYNGKALAAGVYTYKIVISTLDGSTILTAGDVSLMR